MKTSLWSGLKDGRWFYGERGRGGKQARHTGLCFEELDAWAETAIYIPLFVRIPSDDM